MRKKLVEAGIEIKEQRGDDHKALTKQSQAMRARGSGILKQSEKYEEISHRLMTVDRYTSVWYI